MGVGHVAFGWTPLTIYKISVCAHNTLFNIIARWCNVTTKSTFLTRVCFDVTLGFRDGARFRHSDRVGRRPDRAGSRSPGHPVWKTRSEHASFRIRIQLHGGQVQLGRLGRKEGLQSLVEDGAPVVLGQSEGHRAVTGSLLTWIPRQLPWWTWVPLHYYCTAWKDYHTWREF